MEEARRLVGAYCTDDWYVRKKPDLAYLLREIDKVRALAAKVPVVQEDGTELAGDQCFAPMHELGRGDP